MLFVHFWLIKMRMDIVHINKTKSKMPSDYSNIIRMPLRIFEYQIRYSLPSLVFIRTISLLICVEKVTL